MYKRVHQWYEASISARGKFNTLKLSKEKFTDYDSFSLENLANKQKLT